jgi:hypothetical protein
MRELQLTANGKVYWKLDFEAFTHSELEKAGNYDRWWLCISDHVIFFIKGIHTSPSAGRVA